VKINYDQTFQKPLTAFGQQLVQMLKDRNYLEIAGHFGFALAFDKPPAEAVAYRIVNCLTGDGRQASIARADEARISVKYFEQPNELSLFGVVMCFLPLEHDDGELMAELIVSTSKDEFHLWLEDISYAA
jgi:hypothetical protein